MNLTLLSIRKLLFQFTEFWIEWFMNFFADSDYYWTEETYPVTKAKNVIINKTTIKRIKSVKKDVLSANVNSNLFKIIHQTKNELEEFVNMGLVYISSVRLIN